MRITTRCLACLLCALLALSPVALAEAPAEAMGAYFKLSDLQLDVDGVTADFYDFIGSAGCFHCLQCA